MNKKYIVLCATAVLVTAFCFTQAMAAGNPAEETWPSVVDVQGVKPGIFNHAETLYGEYSKAANEQILFEVETVARGPLSELGDAPFGTLLETPAYRVEATTSGKFITGLTLTPEPSIFEIPDLQYSVTEFEGVGYPVRLGVYRKLRVGMAVDGHISDYEALEFCWPSLGHCALLDPSVEFLESIVGNIRRLEAEGWAPKEYTPVLFRTKDASPNCVLTSTQTPFRQRVWNSHSVEYKNVYGIVVVTKELGRQEVTLSCTVEDNKCKAVASVAGDASDCFANLGFDCAHDDERATGAEAPQAKGISETKVTHRIALPAKAEGEISDVGKISVTIDWELNGSVDANGGELIDSCVDANAGGN